MAGGGCCTTAARTVSLQRSSILDHVNATIVPYQFSKSLGPFTWAGRMRGL